MRLCDLSLKAKLLATNALMIAIPICVLVVIGAALLGGLRHTGTLQQQALELLWPEKGSALSVQFALSSLRAESEKNKFKLRHVESDIRILERAGIRLFARQRKAIYLTQGADEEDIQYVVAGKCGTKGSALVWDTEGLFFRYEGMRSDTVIMGTGIIPMMGGSEDLMIPNDTREAPSRHRSHSAHSHHIGRYFVPRTLSRTSHLGADLNPFGGNAHSRGRHPTWRLRSRIASNGK